ncbi:hypothetical protein GQ457_07G039370 [Hibiscus cannabinus]
MFTADTKFQLQNFGLGLDGHFRSSSYQRSIGQERTNDCIIRFRSWKQAVPWACTHLRGKSLIVLILKLAWCACIYVNRSVL